jgi:DNA-binding MarR family transcriptional regulator
MNIEPGHHQEGATGPQPQDVLELLVTTAHALRRFGEAHMAHVKLQPNLSPARMRVLKEVALSDTLRMGDLAERLGVAPRTVTDLIDGLEKEGMLIRRVDPTDRRATLLELSPEMAKNWNQLLDLFADLSERILAPLDDAERGQLFDLLSRLKSNLVGGIPVDDAWAEEAGHADASSEHESCHSTTS